MMASFVTFMLLRLTGDVATALAGEGASDLAIAEIRQRYGLDQPLLSQYLAWLHLLLQGDLGTSIYHNAPVAQLIWERLGTTLLLGSLSIAFALSFALPLGILGALKPGGVIDTIGTSLAMLGQAIPTFWLALLLVIVFGVHLRLLPISGSDTLLHFIMPAMAVGFYFAPPILRLTRAGMIDAMKADYVRMAISKGLPMRIVVIKHALRNALLPLISLTAVEVGFVLSGSLVVETIFSIQGVGLLAYNSVVRGDFPLLQGFILVLSVVFNFLVLAADLISAWIDPRLRQAK